MKLSILLAATLGLAAMAASSVARADDPPADLTPCPPPGEPDASCADSCSTDEWCYAGDCYPRQGVEDPAGCYLGHDESCAAGLYCSWSSGECEEPPRLDCSPYQPDA